MISFIAGLLFTIDVICAFLLIGIILIQQSKSGGGLGAISGGATESVFGAAAGNVITKTTVALASIFLVSTLLLTILSKYQPQSETLSEQLRQKEKQQTAEEDVAAGSDTEDQAESEPGAAEGDGSASDAISDEAPGYTAAAENPEDETDAATDAAVEDQ